MIDEEEAIRRKYDRLCNILTRMANYVDIANDWIERAESLERAQEVAVVLRELVKEEFAREVERPE